MADATELPKSSWHEALDSLTREHQGEVVTIEVTTSDYGDQLEAEELPFAYVEYDPHDDAVSVGVGGSDGRYPVVLRHVIEQPKSVMIDLSSPDETTAIAAVAPDGAETIITLRPRAALPT
jgi:hypothetical protein